MVWCSHCNTCRFPSSSSLYIFVFSHCFFKLNLFPPLVKIYRCVSHFAQFCHRSWCLETASSMPSCPCCHVSATRCTRRSHTCPTTLNTRNHSLSSQQATAYRSAPARPPIATPARPTAARQAAPPPPIPTSHTHLAALSPAALSRCQVRLILRMVQFL